MRIFILCLLLSTQAFALTGGSFSTNPRYSGIVKIRTSFGVERNRQTCTGAFITPRHILTAAHCLLNNEKNDPMSPITIDISTFPKMDLFWDPITVSIPHARFEIHPGYVSSPKPSNPNDIAVVILDRASSQSPLRLADSSAAKGMPVLMTGYGCDKKTKDWATDFKYGSNTVAEVGSLIKLGRSSSDYCEGDSGSPLLIETSRGLRIVGVSSYVNLVKGAFGLSKDRVVPINAHLAWIKKQLAK